MTARSDVGEPPRPEPAEDFPEAVVDELAHLLHKPRARGWIHVYSAVVAAIAGAALVSVSWALDSTRAGMATLVYTLHERGDVRRQRRLPPGALALAHRGTCG